MRSNRSQISIRGIMFLLILVGALIFASVANQAFNLTNWTLPSDNSSNDTGQSWNASFNISMDDVLGTPDEKLSKRLGSSVSKYSKKDNMSDFEVETNDKSIVVKFKGVKNDSQLLEVKKVKVKKQSGDPDLKTDAVFVNSFDFENAEITLSKNPNVDVNVIYYCADEIFDGECLNGWIDSGMSFIIKGNKIVFNVTHFTAYAGGYFEINETYGGNFTNTLYDSIVLKLGYIIDLLYYTENTQSDFDGIPTQTQIGTGSPSNITLAFDSSIFGDGRDGNITISSSYNISVNKTASRSCADGIAYNVNALGSTWANVTTTVSASCINTSDKILLINLQGTSTNYNNTGNYEILTVQSVSGSNITFTSSKIKYYGNGQDSDDTNIGTSATNQRVIIQRIPQYGNVTVQSGGTLTAKAWNGTNGGVLIFYANIIVDVKTGGSIDMNKTGYRSTPAAGGQQGESYAGTGGVSINRNFGGGGGSQDYGNPCYYYTGAAGGGYATSGTADGGSVQGGNTYGTSTLSDIFLGSAGGWAGERGGSGGGIIYIQANSLNISGNIYDRGESLTDWKGGGGSGGSVYIKAGNAILGTAKIISTGGVGGSISDECDSFSGAGGNGRIYIVSNDITGSTSPAATTAGYDISYYNTGDYISGIINMTGLVSWLNISWLEGGNVSVTARTDMDGDFADASSWNSCEALSSGEPLNASSCVNQTHEYLQYKVYMNTSNTSQTPYFKNLSISYYFNSYHNGTYTSKVYNHPNLSLVVFKYVSYLNQSTIDTNITYQIAVNNDNTTWNYYGPDGTAFTYYTYSGQSLVVGAAKFLRYRMYLSSDNITVTPQVINITISYGYPNSDNNMSSESNSSSDNSYLIIWDSYETGSRSINLTFYANYTNSTSKEPINGTNVYCSFIENSYGSWSTPVNMTFNPTSELYEITKTIIIDGDYRIWCDGTPQGYDLLNVSERIRDDGLLQTIFIWSDTLFRNNPTGSLVKYLNMSYTFYANVTYSYINDSKNIPNCTVRFKQRGDDWSSYYPMIYNSTLQSYIYNYSFTKGGSHDYFVNCSDGTNSFNNTAKTFVFWNTTFNTIDSESGDGEPAAYSSDNSVWINEMAYFYANYTYEMGAVKDLTKIRASDAAASDYFGYSVSSGDVNGDGFSDVIVGAYYAMDVNSAEGLVYVYLGNARGVDLGSEVKLRASDAAASDYFGYSVSSGDVNGDGFDDVIVGAYLAEDVNADEGLVYVYLGNASGVSSSSQIKLRASDAAANDNFGKSVSSGDVNGDGFSDVIVGAIYAEDVNSAEGLVYVYLGNASGVDLGSEVKLRASDAAASDYFGNSVSSGDVNGDGFDDVIVGASMAEDVNAAEGLVYVYLGNASGVVSSSQIKLRASDATGSDTFGNSVSSGDVNGDGFDDVIVGAVGAEDVASNEGLVYVYLGNASGVVSSSEIKLRASDSANADGFGFSVSSGDVDGDGFDDVIVGATAAEDVNTGEGLVYVYLGNASGVSSSRQIKLRASDAAAMDQFGNSVSSGDVDGDGFDDVIVGASMAEDVASTEGLVYVSNMYIPSSFKPWSNCTIDFSDGTFQMIYNFTTQFYHYSRIFSTSGLKTYDINCTKFGYEPEFISSNITIQQTPDLNLASLTVPAVNSDQILTAYVNVSNIGNATATNANVSCYMDGTLFDSYILTIPAGSYNYSTCTRNVSIYGGKTWQINATVDPSNSIVEILETNNKASKNVNITQVTDIDAYDEGSLGKPFYAGSEGRIFINWSKLNNAELVTTSIVENLKISSGGILYSIAVDDFDGDGHNEIVAGKSGSLGIYNDSGNLIKAFTSVGSNWPYDIEIYDLDGVGEKEIIYSDKSGVLKVLDSDLNVLNSTSFGVVIYTLDVVDLEGDGEPEIIVGLGSTSNELRVFDRTLKLLWSDDFPGMIDVHSIKIADINLDGNLEVVAGGDTYTKAYDYLGNQLWNVSLGAVGGIGIGDLLPNPGLEVISGSGGYGKFYLLSSEGDLLDNTGNFGDTYDYSRNIEITDVDGDGDNEVVIGAKGYSGYYGRFYVFDENLNKIYGGYLVGSDIYQMVKGDINNDGINEFSLGLGGEYQFSGYGKEYQLVSKDSSNLFSYNFGSTVFYHSIVHEDMDFDGVDDVIVASQDGNLITTKLQTCKIKIDNETNYKTPLMNLSSDLFEYSIIFYNPGIHNWTINCSRTLYQTQVFSSNTTVYVPTLVNYTFNYSNNYVDILDDNFTVTAYYYRTDTDELANGTINITFNGQSLICSNANTCTKTFDNAGLGNYQILISANNSPEYYASGENEINISIVTLNVTATTDKLEYNPDEDIIASIDIGLWDGYLLTESNVLIHILLDGINIDNITNVWRYNKDITIPYANATNSNDHIVNLSIDTQTLISSGKMKSDCSDLKLSFNGSQLPYWIQSGCNTSSTKIWTKVDFLANTDKIIQMKYGNPLGESESDVNDVFGYYEDFESRNISGWSTPTEKIAAVSFDSYAQNGNIYVLNTSSTTKGYSLYIQGTDYGYYTAGWSESIKSILTNKTNISFSLKWVDGNGANNYVGYGLGVRAVNSSGSSKWISYRIKDGTSVNVGMTSSCKIFDVASASTNVWYDIKRNVASDFYNNCSGFVVKNITGIGIFLGEYQGTESGYVDNVYFYNSIDLSKQSILSDEGINYENLSQLYNITLPQVYVAGNHELIINATNEGGIYGEASIAFGVNIVGTNETAFSMDTTEQVAHANVGDAVNISVYIDPSNIDLSNPLDSVWANIYDSFNVFIEKILLFGNALGGWWTGLFTNTTSFGTYIVDFGANLSDGFDYSNITNATFGVEALNVTISIDDTLYNQNENITIMGHVNLWNGSDIGDVADNNISVYIDGVLQTINQTDVSGDYNFSIITPSAAGPHTLTVNLTDPNGIYGESSPVSFNVSIGMQNESATSYGTSTNHANFGETLNISVNIPSENIGDYNLSGVWAWITKNITIYQNYSIKDTYIEQFNPTASHTNDQLYLGAISNQDNYVLIQFNTSMIPSLSVIENATLRFFVEDNLGSNQIVNLTAYIIDDAWDESVTWNTQPAASYLTSSKAVDFSSLSYGSYIEIDITDAVELWAQGTPNNGLMIRTDAILDNMSVLGSRDDVGEIPRLTVKYSIPEMIDLTVKPTGGIQETDYTPTEYGNYRVMYFANLTNGFDEIYTSPTYFYVEDLILNLSTDKSYYTTTEDVNVIGKVQLSNGSIVGDVADNYVAMLLDGYKNIEPSDGRVLLLHFNNQNAYGESNTKMYDFSGNGNNGSCTGSTCPAWISTDNIMGAFKFDGVDDKISLPYTSSLNITTNSMAISVWVKVNPKAGNQMIYSKWGGSNSHALYYDGTNKRIYFFIYAGAGSSNIFNSANLEDGGWHNIIAVYNSTNTMMYLDGSMLPTKGTISGNIASSGNAARIGYDGTGFGAAAFNGSIDELMVYNRSLTSGEINRIFFSGLNRFTDSSGNYNFTIKSLLSEGNHTFYVNVTDDNGIFSEAQVSYEVWAETFVNYTYNTYYTPNSTINITAWYWRNDTGAAIAGNFNITIDGTTKSCFGVHECNLKFYTATASSANDFEAGNKTITISAENSTGYKETANKTFKEYIQRVNATTNFNPSTTTLSSYSATTWSYLFNLSVTNTQLAEMKNVSIGVDYFIPGTRVIAQSIVKKTNNCRNLSFYESCYETFNLTVTSTGLSSQSEPLYVKRLNYTNNQNKKVSISKTLTVALPGNPGFDISSYSASFNDNLSELKSILINITNMGNLDLKNIEIKDYDSSFFTMSEYEYLTYLGEWVSQYEEYDGTVYRYEVDSIPNAWTNPGWNLLGISKYATVNVSFQLSDYSAQTIFKQINFTAIPYNNITYSLNQTLTFNITIDVKPNFTISDATFSSNENFSQLQVFSSSIIMNGNAPQTDITFTKVGGDMPVGWISYQSGSGFTTDQWPILYEGATTPFNITIDVQNYTPHNYTAIIGVSTAEGLSRNITINLSIAPNFLISNTSFTVTDNLSYSHEFQTNITLTGNAPLTNLTIINNGNINDSWVTFNGTFGFITDTWETLTEGVTATLNITIQILDYLQGIYSSIFTITTDEGLNQSFNITLDVNPELTVSSSITDSIIHNTSKVFSFDMDSSGNVKVKDIDVTYVQQTLPSSWLNQTSYSISEILEYEGETRSFRITVPAHYAPGTYTGYFNITSYNDIDRRVNISITVNASGTWYYTTTYTGTVSVSINQQGKIANITIYNTGNIPLNFTAYVGDIIGAPETCLGKGIGNTCVDFASLGSDITSQEENSESFTLDIPKGSSKKFSIYTDEEISNSYASVGILVNMTASSGIPSYNESMMYFNIFDQPPVIKNPAYSPASYVEINKEINMSFIIEDDVNLTYNGVYINVTQPGMSPISYAYTNYWSLVPFPKKYSYLFRYNKTNVSGTYNYTIYARDSSNGTTLYNSTFRVIGNTSLSASYASSVNADGVTRYSQKKVSIPVLINNTGLVNAYNINLSGTFGANATSFTKQEIIISKLSTTSTTKYLNITVPNTTAAGTYYFTPLLKFTQPNGTNVTQALSQIAINVTPTHNFTLLNRPTSDTIQHNTYKTYTLYLDADGNVDESGITLQILNQSTGLTATLSTYSISSISKDTNTSITLNVSIDDGASAKDRYFTIRVYDSHNNKSYATTITTPVNRSYQISHSNLTINGVAGTPTINQKITIESDANVNLTFAVSLTGNMTNFSDADALTLSALVNTSPKLTPTKNITIKINYTSPLDNKHYAGTLTINGTAIPITFNNYYYDLNILNVTPTEVLEGDDISIIYEIRYNNPPFINTGLTSQIMIAGTDCPITSESNSGNKTYITCTAPAIPDGATHQLNAYVDYDDGSKVIEDIQELESTGLNKAKIYYTDITTPTINSISITDSITSSNFTASLNVTDNKDIEEVYLYITNTGGSNVMNLTLSNSTPYIFTGEANIATPGYYTARVYAIDKTGNVNSLNTSVFQIYSFVQLIGNVYDNPIEYNPGRIYFNFTTSTNYTNFSSDVNGDYDHTIKTDYYDLKMRIPSINTTINVFDADFNNPPQDFLDVYSFDYGLESGAIKGFVFDGDMINNATVEILFTLSEIIAAKTASPELIWTTEKKHVRMYQCNNYYVGSESESPYCPTSWVKISTSQGTSTGKSTGTTSSFSNGSTAFLLTMQSQTEGEITILNSSVTFSTDHNRSISTSIKVQSTGAIDASNVHVACDSGEACTLFSMPEVDYAKIIADQLQVIPISFTIPRYTENKTYIGRINISHEDGYSTIPLYITVLPDKNYSISSTSITKQSGGMRDVSIANITVTNIGNTVLNLNLVPDSPLELNVTSISVPIQGTGKFSISATTPHDIGIYDYDVVFTGESKSVAVRLNITHQADILDISPTSKWYSPQNVTIYANAKYLTQNNSNAVWVVDFNGVPCTSSGSINNVIWCKVPQAVGTIVQNLTVTGYFNGSYATDKLEITMRDQMGPIIYNVTDSILYTDGISNINVTYYDDTGLYLNGTTVTMISPSGNNMTPVSISIIDEGILGIYANYSELGDYNISVRLRDNTSYKSPSSTYTQVFEVYQPINLAGKVDYSNVGVQTNFTFYRPGTDEIIHYLQADSNGNYATSGFHNRTYDIMIRAKDIEVILYDGRIITNNDIFNIKYVDLQNADQIIIQNPDGRNYDLWAFYADNKFNFTRGTLRMYYSVTDYPDVKVAQIHMLKCSDFDASNIKCNGNFVDLGQDDYEIVGNKRYIEVNISSFSAYALSEFSVVIATLPEDLARVTSAGGGGGGSAGGWDEGISEALFNETIAKYFGQKDPVTLDITEISRDMFVGEVIRGGFKVANDFNQTLTFHILTSGDISNFMTFDTNFITIDSKSKEDLVYTITVPETTKPGTYTGDILLRTDYYEKKVPVNLRVDEVKEQKLTLELVPETKIIIPGRAFEADANLYNPAGHDLNMTLYVDLYDSLTQRSVYNSTLNFMLDDYYTYHVVFDIGKDLRVDKNYVLRAVAEYRVAHQKFDVRSFVNVEVQYPFVLREIFGIRVWKILIGMLILSLIVTSYLLLHNYLDRKKRYHTQVEYSQLPKAGPDSLFLGRLAETNTRTFLDIDKLMTHTIVAGSTGGGKSISAQVIAEEVLAKNRSVIVFDPTAQWSGFLRKLEDQGLLKLYPNFDISQNQARAFKGNVHIIKDARQEIDIVKYMKPGEIHVFTINQLDPNEIDLFVASTVSQVFHANLEEARTLKALIVYDEVHRLLPKFGGSGEGFIQIERACREFRKWGVGMMLISQVLSDFVGQIKANINTEIQVRTKDENDLDRIKMKYGDEFVHGVIKADIGTGILANAAYNRGRPYFVTFRPIYHSVSRLDDGELDKYAKFNDRIEDIEYQLDVLKEKGVDIFDFELELKLSVKKLMSGSFNMVNIYLEGIEPRIKDAFKKLDMEVPKKKIKLVDTRLIEKSILEAKKSREEHIKKEAEAAKKNKQAAVDDVAVEDDKPLEEDNVAEEVLVVESAEEKQEEKKEPIRSISKEAVKEDKPERPKKEEKAYAPILKPVQPQPKEKSGFENKKHNVEVYYQGLSALIDSLEHKHGPLSLYKSRINVLSKKINLAEDEKALGEIFERLKSLKHDLIEEFK